MFCKNCGSEIENGAKFCNNCGSPQETPTAAPIYDNTVQPAPQQTVPVYENPTQPTVTPVAPQQDTPQYNSSVPYNPNGNLQPPVQAKKSSKGCIVAIIVVAVVFVLSIIGIVALIVSNVSTDTDNYTSDGVTLFDDSVTASNTPSAEYTAIFEDNNIAQAPAVFVGLDSRAFACIDSDGMIENMEFGYDGDTIKELVDTIYYPINDYSDDVLSVLDESFKESFAPADELDCCTVTYSKTADYYIITVHSTDLDNVLNLTDLSDAGVITYDGFALSLSMDETATGLIADGYVER
ncbi:MAG: zinc-ribbon domain-containing protein [Ruminococcus sp.]|nr:zinc-ribbon domain-containing protein [Ruminococcus sp.]